jgi:hypothetical protein
MLANDDRVLSPREERVLEAVKEAFAHTPDTWSPLHSADPHFVKMDCCGLGNGLSVGRAVAVIDQGLELCAIEEFQKETRARLQRHHEMDLIPNTYVSEASAAAASAAAAASPTSQLLRSPRSLTSTPPQQVHEGRPALRAVPFLRCRAGVPDQDRLGADRGRHTDRPGQHGAPQLPSLRPASTRQGDGHAQLRAARALGQHSPN